ESTVNTTYSRLSSLSMFNGVNIGMTQSDTALVNCGINLTQSKLQGFKANLEASSNSSGLMGVSPQLSFYHKNIFHGGEVLNLSFMGNFQFKFNDPIRSDEFGVSSSISFPKFIGLPYRIFNGPNIPRTEVSASYNYQHRPEYTRSIISTSFGYTGSYKKLSYQVYPVQLSVIRLNDMDPSFYESLSRNPFMRYSYQDHFDAGFGSTLYLSSTTETNPSSSYRYIRIATDFSGNLLSLLKPVMNTNDDGASLIWGIPFSQYIKEEVTLGQTWFFGRNNGQAIATRLLAGIGYAYGNSSALPFEKQFYSGGANSMRGWQARSLGPGFSPMNETFTIPSQTGDMKLEANVEYRFKMFWKLAGALFVDAGNIWASKNAVELSSEGQRTIESIAMDWGAGARVDLNFLVLRLDMGMKLHDPSRPYDKWVKPDEWLKRDGFAVHFGVGYPF
ncbi:MAG: BamA/TamA family outer membrane protein, partial [Bacteroidia bacterium]|nr:BamA/TamA family outer membrane protein [Bacteroidia bacterium]